ncbi:MAG: hypothetical protein WCH99_12865 [Verrucomicrobiota bacterium]
MNSAPVPTSIFGTCRPRARQNLRDIACGIQFKRTRDIPGWPSLTVSEPDERWKSKGANDNLK